MTPHAFLLEIYHAALAAVDPYQAVLASLRIEQNILHAGDAQYDLATFKRIVVVGAGKATARMALAIEGRLGERISAGLIIIKAGHHAELSHIQQRVAAHPLPNQAGVEATQEILKIAREADSETLLICLLSGGASALLVAPLEGISLDDKQMLTRELLKAGANIVELNSVRKHLSAVKGGRLLQAAYPAQVLTLILSDVIGDSPDVIASGPTVADRSTYADAISVLERYHLLHKISPRVNALLQQGKSGMIEETLKLNDFFLRSTKYKIVAGNQIALQAAMAKARQLGFPVRLREAAVQGEAREAARLLATEVKNILDQMRPNDCCCYLSGGETTVTVMGAGQGGRNQELALAFALEIQGQAGITLLSAATDGGDGDNDAAGATVNGNTVAQAHQIGLEARDYLEANDAYHFFQKLDAGSGKTTHLKTGPTGTNVMDLQMILLLKQ
jgi:hydroxypyruvate reductase